MSYAIRRSEDRKYFDHGWLRTYHTFSFGAYRDPAFMGFRDLRVINEDRVAEGKGFPPHSHRDMEIISIVLEGELHHKDDMGNVTALGPGSIQSMSAGTGVTHSEYNGGNGVVHFMQIWIIPDATGYPPRYQESLLPDLGNEWVLIAAKEGLHAPLNIQQDVKIYAISLAAEQNASHKLSADRYAWLQIIDGSATWQKETLNAGDGVAISSEIPFDITAKEKCRALLFDLR